MKKTILTITCLLGASMAAQAQLQTSAGIQYLQCMPKDQSGDFSDLSNTYFLADSLASFDVAKGEGTGRCGCIRSISLTQNMITTPISPLRLISSAHVVCASVWLHHPSRLRAATARA